MGINHNPGAEVLHGQMASALERGAPWLHFPHPLEERFERDRRSSRSQLMRVGVLIALVIYDLFLICDYRFFRQHFLRCLVLRLAVVTPIVLGMYLWLHLDPPKRLRESATVLVSCFVSVSTLYLWHGGSGVAASFAQTALVLLILFVNTIMRPRFLYALASTFLCVGEGMVFLHWDLGLTVAEKVTALSLVATGALFSLVANCWMEREERLSYLLHTQVERRGIELSAANRELTRLSNLDALTGLANRRHFAITFEEIWAEAARDGKPVSLVLADIDHFKKINDDYGHLRGDEILVRVAQALQSELFREEFRIARYGGEEFVLVLPGVAIQEALDIAERLRRRIRTIETPIQEGRKPRRVTISLGVASTRPLSYMHRAQLIRDADLALYEAKTHGRDCVQAALTAVEDQLQTDDPAAVGIVRRLDRDTAISGSMALVTRLL